MPGKDRTPIGAADVLAQFRATAEEPGLIDEPSVVLCSCCGLPLVTKSQRRLSIRLYLGGDDPAPFVLRYDVCKKCTQTYRLDGSAYRAMIERFNTLLSDQAFASRESGAGPEH